MIEFLSPEAFKRSFLLLAKAFLSQSGFGHFRFDIVGLSSTRLQTLAVERVFSLHAEVTLELLFLFVEHGASR